MSSMFRELTASEIECRVGRVSEKKVELLLYKTSRVDADILDETVGPENWQCEFYEQKGTLFCKVGIDVDRGDGLHEWVWKADAGAPSNMEAQKGEASDAFKRASFKWGIGRELYTAPRIAFWVEQDGELLCKVEQNKAGKWTTYDDFSVRKVEIDDHRIRRLWIVNDTLRKTVFVLNPVDDDSR